MRTSRLVVFILLVSGIIAFFMLQAELDDNSRWALVGVILLLAIIWVFLGDAPEKGKSVAKVAVRQVSSEESEEGNTRPSFSTFNISPLFCNQS